MNRTKGYTEIVKITEAALTGDVEKAKKYVKEYISKFPESDLIKPFNSLLNGELNPDKLSFDHNPTQTLYGVCRKCQGTGFYSDGVGRYICLH